MRQVLMAFMTSACSRSYNAAYKGMQDAREQANPKKRSSVRIAGASADRMKPPIASNRALRHTPVCC